MKSYWPLLWVFGDAHKNIKDVPLSSDLESTNLMVIDISHPNSYLIYSHILIGWFSILHAVLYLQHRMSAPIEQSFSVQTTSCRLVRPDQFCWPVAWIHTSVWNSFLSSVSSFLHATGRTFSYPEASRRPSSSRSNGCLGGKTKGGHHV